MRKDKGSWAYFLGASAAIGLGLLAKGPVALAGVVCAVIPYLVWRRRWSDLISPRWIAAAGVMAAVCLAWFLPALHHEGWGLLDEMIGKQVGSRLVGSEANPQPFLYYAIKFPEHFLPWFLFFPFALVYLWKRRQENPFFAFTWFLLFFIALSAVSSKLDRYMLPLYPPAALMVGYYLPQKQRNPIGLVAIIAAGVGAVGAVGWAIFRQRDALGYALAGGAILLAAAVVGLIYWKRWGFRTVIGVAFAYFLVVALTFNPYKNSDKSIRPLAEFLKQQGATAENVIWYRAYEPEVAFYARFPVMRVEKRMEPLENYPGIWVIAKRKHVDGSPFVFPTPTPVRSFKNNKSKDEELLVFRTPSRP